MNISNNTLTFNFNKKRIIILLIYILISIVVHYLLADSPFITDNIERIVHFVGFVLGAVIRWIFLLAFFFRNEELVSRYQNWKRKGIRFVSILLVLIVFSHYVPPFTFVFDYFVTWLILIKGVRAEKTSENDLN